MAELPTFKSQTLAEFVESLRKRRKAITYAIHTIRVERVIERTTSPSIEADKEKLEIELRLGRSRVSPVVRAYVWDDRWAFIDARQGSKSGWIWEWNREGMLLGSTKGRQFVEALEETSAVASSMTAAQTDVFGMVWKSLFASKPRLVK